VPGIVVVDASLALKWVLEEAYTDAAEVLLLEWQHAGIRRKAPDLLGFEVANALHRRVVRGEITLDQARQLLTTLLDLGPELVSGPSLHVRALELAHQFGRPASYDAHYLALAESLGGELWTVDERLWNAVKDALPWVRWVGEPRP
jgi:predicted nucleic acid-binding protein